MHKTLIIVFVGCCMGFSALAQQLSKTPVSIDLSNTSLNKALSQLNDLDGIKLSYSPDILKNDRIQGKKYISTPVDQVLREILGNGYELKYRGSYIIIQQKQRATKKSKFSFAGEIKDAQTGETLKNVTVYEVNSLDATLSDDQGDFELSVTSKSDYVTVAISRENYKDTLIQVGPSDRLNVPIKLQRVDESKTTNKLLIAEEFSKVAHFFTTQISRINIRNVRLKERRPYQVSLVPVVGTNGKLGGRVDNKISFNLIAGYGNSLDKGLELGGVYNILRRDAKGVQLSGFGNAIGGDVRGLQVAGFANTNKGEVTGVQAAGFANIITKPVIGGQLAGFVNLSGELEGVQLAGFVNVATDSIKGVQGAGFVNIAPKTIDGAQLAGFVNFASKAMSGAQFAGFVNIAANRFKGFQVAGFTNLASHAGGVQVSGFYNQSQDLKGTQISGFINVAGKVRGVQIGVLNIADTVERGVTIGLVNLVRKGKTEFALENTDFMTGLLTFRSGTNALYTILSTGMDLTGTNLWSYGIGMGRQIAFSKKLYTNLELSAYNISASGRRHDSLNLLSRFNLNVGFYLTKTLSLNVGPTFNWYVTQFQNEETGLLGDEIFNTTASDKVSDNIRGVTWFGYTTSLRIRL